MLSSKSIKKIAKVMLLAAMGLSLGIGGAFLVDPNPSGSMSSGRDIASVGGVRPSRLVLGKQAAALNVEIQGPSTVPENSSEIVELTGTITQNLEGDGMISYKWALPQGVELVRGPLASTISEVSLGQPRSVSILVKGFSRAKQKLISLSCQLQKAGQELTASAVIVSRPEDTAESRVMSLEAQARADAEAEREANSDKE